MISVLFYMCGDRTKASSRVRGYWLAEELRERGVKCSLDCRHSKLALLLFALKILFYDIIVFQKSYSRWHCFLMSWAKLAGKKTVIDLDDAPSRTNNSVTLKNVEYMLRNVSVVTVGSRALFDYATGYSDNVYLIPSCVRLKYYRSLENRENAKDFICLGWIGNGKHYKEDLISILREPLAEVAKKSPIRLKLIGVCGEKDLYAAFSGIPGLHLDFIDQIDWSDPGAVSGALQDVDIGLYPLLQNEFNKYKCGFKALEYMAMGVPVVSSDVAENREIVIEGENGFFAYGSDEWRDALGQLVADASLRRRFGVNGRKLVEERYSVRVAAGLFLRAVDGDDL